MAYLQSEGWGAGFQPNFSREEQADGRPFAELFLDLCSRLTP